jgi:hypothetical protein
VWAGLFMYLDIYLDCSSNTSNKPRVCPIKIYLSLFEHIQRILRYFQREYLENLTTKFLQIGLMGHVRLIVLSV